jgi:hypothetical protein
VSEYRNREEVMDLMLRVRTLEECERARELAIRWIEEHPADQDYILLAGEHLERVRQALFEKEEEGGVSQEPGYEDVLHALRVRLAGSPQLRFQPAEDIGRDLMKNRYLATEPDPALVRRALAEIDNSEREEDALRQVREELAQLEAQRVQISGEVMEGRPGALEEDEQLRARIVELGHWLLEAEKESGQEGGDPV